MRVLFAALAAATSASAFQMSINVTNLTTQYAPANVSWNGNQAAADGDWLAVVCLPSQTYFWWVYTNGAASGSSLISLYANGKSSNCDSIAVAYYDTGSAIVGMTQPITVAPMIQQMRLSQVSDPSALVVDFVSSTPEGGIASCSYGTSPTGLTSYARAVTAHFATIGNVSHALLTQLAPNTRYYYACKDAGATSEIASFVAAPEPTGRPYTVAVFADFGVDDGFGLEQIQQDAWAGKFDAVCHSGDFAYDFESDDSANGNFFLNRASTYSSSLPTNVAPGSDCQER